MELVTKDEQFERLRDILLPILADAAVGRFDQDVPMPVDGSHHFNQMLMGVQILLEVIRELQLELEASQVELADVQGRTTEILARILDRTLPDGQRF